MKSSPSGNANPMLIFAETSPVNGSSMVWTIWRMKLALNHVVKNGEQHLRGASKAVMTVRRLICVSNDAMPVSVGISESRQVCPLKKSLISQHFLI
jgi:hypothetical protein